MVQSQCILPAGALWLRILLCGGRRQHRCRMSGRWSNTELSSLAPARDATPRSGSMAHAWDTSRGDANVTIRNGQVNAKLFFEDSKKECKSRSRVPSRVRTWWFGRRFITDFGSGETFRGLDTFRKGPNRREVIIFSNSIATT